MTTLAENQSIRIELDEDYNSRPGDFVGMGAEEDAAYVKRFEDGELLAYVVTVVSTGADGVTEDYQASLSGVDVEDTNAEGTYHTLESITDSYLRQVATELLAEVADQAPKSHWAVTAISDHPALRDVSEDCPECLALAEGAVAIARVTGSRGSTSVDGDHSVTVTRVLKVITV